MSQTPKSNLYPQLTDNHRIFLQYIMEKGYCEKQTAENFIKQELKQNRTSMDQLIAPINDALEMFHFRLQIIRHPKTRVDFVGICNEVGDDDISLRATNYDIHEIVFIKKILELIVENDEKRENTKLTDCLNVRERLKMEDAEAYFAQFVRDGWLDYDEEKSSDVWYGVRTLIDLRGYMNEQYEVDILKT